MLTSTKHNKSIPSPFCNKGWLLLLTLKAIQFPNHQDAIDLDMATQEEKKRLIAWKKYRVLVNRIETSPTDNIVWPAKPY